MGQVLGSSRGWNILYVHRCDLLCALSQPAGDEAVTSRFAATTNVSSARTKDEIERIVKKYGAKSFGSFDDGNKVVVLFETQDRRVRFTIPMPDRGAKEFGYEPHRGLPRSERAATQFWEQACRQRWRALLLAIKAKLESVEAGIESFDEAFLSHIVLPDGETFGPRALDAITIAYSGKPLPPLLAGPQ
jgi:hypothetical protein